MTSTRVATGSRLHFGLLRLPPRPNWTDDGKRYYGGAGLMVDAPAVVVIATPASEWAATGPSAERALAAARRVIAAAASNACFALRVECCPAEHVGLGAGTQLELAAATAVSRAIGRSDDALTLAAILGRGARSAIGIHGFWHGGFIVDGGKRRPSEIGARAARLDFPSDWRVLLFTPAIQSAWYGDQERTAFAAMDDRPDAELPRLLRDMVAAIGKRDFAGFTQTVHEYNARAGDVFRSIQGGRYADPAIEALIEWLRIAGVAGCGQSSWGPTVFAVMDDLVRAEQIVEQVGRSIPARIVNGRNCGAAICPA